MDTLGGSDDVFYIIGGTPFLFLNFQQASPKGRASCAHETERKAVGEDPERRQSIAFSLMLTT